MNILLTVWWVFVVVLQLVLVAIQRGKHRKVFLDGLRFCVGIHLCTSTITCLFFVFTSTDTDTEMSHVAGRYIDKS